MSAVSAEGRAGVAWEFFAYLGGPAAYALHLLASTALVPLACDLGSTWPLHLLTAVVLLAIAGSAVTAWRLWRRARDDEAGADPAEAADAAPALRRGRRWFLGLSGLMLSTLSFAVVVFSEVANHAFHPCLP